MKNLLYIYSIFITFTIHSQTLTGIYINQNIGSVGGDNKLTQKAKIPKLYAYSYSGNKSNLVLLSEGGKIIDTLKRKLQEYNFDYETVETTITATKVNYHKDFNKNLFEKISTLNNEETYIKDTMPFIDWSIGSEKKTISGYDCTKATAERKVMGYPLKITAWFCEKIPLNDGPFDFQGLPGFIFELTVEGLSKTKFVNLNYKQDKIIEIKPTQSDTTPVTMKEFENRFK